MAGYVKLFGSILQSTIWEEPPTTRCVWITMLAMSDMDGVVSASVPGLARMAGVTRADCETALGSFLAPDPDSRTKEHEGRRIEAVDGGWILLNHAKYRAMQTRDERREKDAERKRRARAGDDSEAADDRGQMRTDADSPQSHAPSRSVTPSEADQVLSLSSQSGSPGNPDQTRSRTYASAPRVFLGAKSPAFLRVFQAYPRRDKEQEAAQVFQELALGHPGGEEALATAIEAAFTRGMLKRHPYSGPNATRPCFDRFLAGRRWEDPESEPDTPAGGPASRQASQPLPKLVGVPRPKFIPPPESPPIEAHGAVTR